MNEPMKRGPGRPTLGPEKRERRTYSFSPAILRVLDDHVGPGMSASWMIEEALRKAFGMPPGERTNGADDE